MLSEVDEYSDTQKERQSNTIHTTQDLRQLRKRVGLKPTPHTFYMVRVCRCDALPTELHVHSQHRDESPGHNVHACTCLALMLPSFMSYGGVVNFAMHCATIFAD